MRFLCVVTACVAMANAALAGFIVKDGETLGFLGDSITAGGQSHPVGYVNLVLRTLEQEGIRVTPVKRGIGGMKSSDMLMRIDKEVLAQRPSVMTLSCGVNDVWHQDNGRGVSLEDYKKNVIAMLDHAAASNCTVVVMTATPFFYKAGAKDPHNVKLEPYNDFLRQIAAERKLPLADLNRMMWEASKTQDWLTQDGVHMRPNGYFVMAKGVLLALGADPAKIPEYEKDWRKVRGGTEIRIPVSLDEFEELGRKAAPYSGRIVDYIRVQSGLEK